MKKYRFYSHPRFIAVVLATVTIGSGVLIIRERKKNDQVNANSEYCVGYLDLNLFNNKLLKKVGKGNFLLLDIGDHDTDGCYFFNQKLDYCQKNGIDVGLILSPDSSNLGEAYLDVSLVKDFVKNYSISYPVYLDVDCLFDHPKLRYDEALLMIKTIVQKLRDSHIAVGIYGKKENVNQERMKSIVDDCYTFYKDDNKDSQMKSRYLENGNVGYLYTDKSLKKELIQNHNNLKSLILEDEYVVYDDSFDFQKLAKSCGLSVWDLKEYNGLNFPFSFLKEGDIIEIPSLNYQTRRHLSSQPKLGIDVSLWQDEIEWEKVDTNYAIIQIRDFAKDSIDPYFNINVMGCMKNHIPMGFYIFSRATTVDELKREISYVKKKLEGIEVTYPVYLDLETDFWQLNTSEEYVQNKEFYQKFIQTWEEEIKMMGYIPGIYCSQDLYQNLNEATEGQLENLSCWVAGGEYYEKVISPSDDSSLPVSNDEKVEIKQVSSKGVMEGISNRVDIDYGYYNYEQEIPHPEKKFYRFNHEVDFVKKMGIGIGIIYVSARVKLFHRKKRRRKRKRSRIN